MSDITFITGNTYKAKYLEKYLGFPIQHIKLDLDEIQSLNPVEIIEHKVIQAYGKVGTPVLVEDVGLIFTALGKLPGPFIKFFAGELGNLGLCRLLDGKSRDAIATCTFAYYDGTDIEIFTGNIEGFIGEEPRGNGGFGWDDIFIPYFSSGQTAAEISEQTYERYYTEIKPLEKVREFLLTRV